MKHFVRKLFVNPDKEEQWLNEMAGKGLGLERCSFCKYEFVEIKPGAYTYKVQLLEEDADTTKSQEYLQFLEEMDITCVTRYRQWIYLRKAAVNGPIELYSDIDSKLSYYKKVHYFYWSWIYIELGAGVLNVLAIKNLSNGRFSSMNRLNLVVGLLILLCIGIFAYADYPIAKQIKGLEDERKIKE